MVSFASLFEADPMEEAEQRQTTEVKMEVTRTPVFATAPGGPRPVDGVEQQQSQQEQQPQQPQQQGQQQQQQQQQPADQSMMEVPEQIVVSKKEKKEKSSKKSHHKRRSSKDKDKVAKRKSSSGTKHERKHRRSSREEGLSKEERRKRRRSSRRHRKSSRAAEQQPDPNDPETLAKSRELLLAAMGVKKKPETAPCFVSTKTSLDNNPVYQSNKKRFSGGLQLSHSESQLASAISSSSFTNMETARSMDDISSYHDCLVRGMIPTSNGTNTAPDQQRTSGSDDSEYDQYVEF